MFDTAGLKQGTMLSPSALYTICSKLETVVEL